MNEEYSVNELKKIEIDLFKNFIKICNKHNFTWFVIGGTCLGTVRHKGFIPWDDDIDVGMPRSDYEAFIRIPSNELPSYISIQSIITEKKYPYNFAKLRNSSTTFIEKSLKDFNINHGVYIDVFPLDGYRNNYWFDKLNSLFSRRIGYSLNFENTSYAFKDRIKKFLLLILFPSLPLTVYMRDKLLKHYDYNTSGLVANFCGAWGKKEIVDFDCFQDGIKGVFEDIDVILPKNYDRYLSSLYGDYMTLPPEDKRIPHHFTTVVDLANSYIKYL